MCVITMPTVSTGCFSLQVSGVGSASVVHQTSAVGAAAAAAVVAAGGATQGSGQFQRLKVEDALSYLDQVSGSVPQTISHPHFSTPVYAYRG